MEPYNSYTQEVYDIPTLIRLMEDNNVKTVELADNFLKANMPLLSNGYQHKYAYFGKRFLDKDIMIGIDNKKITYYYENSNGIMKKISKKIEIKKPLK